MELVEAACASGDSFTPAHDGRDSSSWGPLAKLPQDAAIAPAGGSGALDRRDGAAATTLGGCRATPGVADPSVKAACEVIQSRCGR